MEKQEKVQLLLKEGFGVLTINNPVVMGAHVLSSEVLLDLKQRLEECRENDGVKFVIITGEGRHFSIGANVKEIWEIAKEGDRQKALELLARANEVANLIQDLNKPTVAAIDGFCLGGGNEIAMACTARIATEEAVFGQPEINLGIMPGMGGTQRLPRLVGLNEALKITLMGNMITAVKAWELGLVDKVVPRKELRSQAKESGLSLYREGLFCYLEKKMFPDVTVLNDENFQAILKTKPPDAVSAILKAVRFGTQLPLKEGLKLEQELFADVVVTDSARKGLAKFLKIELGNNMSGDEPEKKQCKTIAASDGNNGQEELKLLRQTAREFCENEIAPQINRMEEEGRLLPELWDKMAELGFLAVGYPEEVGGMGYGIIGDCIFSEELSRVHPSTAITVGAHSKLACGALFVGGNAEQIEKYLKPSLQGKLAGAFALTEAEAGSDASNIRTTSQKDGNEWVINGSKRFITNADFADFVVVIAQTNPELGQKGLTAFIVETKWPGYKVEKVEKKVGLHASRTCELSLANVRVPTENMLGGIGDGFKIFMKALNGGRLALAAGCLGMAKAAFEQAFDHASARKQFGQPLTGFQNTQFKLAEMASKIYLMEQGVYTAAAKADSGRDVRMEAAMLKLMCSEMMWQIVDDAVQIHGGNSFMEEYPIARLFRDSRVYRIFEGTNEIQKLLIFKGLATSDGKI